MNRKLAVLIFFWVFLTFAFFRQTRPDWNVNSRLALTYAIVEQQRFTIDTYQNMPEFDSGGDKAFYEGHYYSDKIIGTSLLGVAPLALGKLVTRLTGRYMPVKNARHLVTVFTSGLFAALSAVLLFLMLRELGLGYAGALWLSGGYAFGTLAAGYATLFYSYLPALFFALGSYWLMLSWRLRERPVDDAPIFAAGLCLGFSLLCEYVMGIVALGLSAYLFVHLKSKWKVLIYWGGTLIPLSLFFAYTLICFDGISIPYKYLVGETFREGMAQGLMGINRFQLPVLWYITFDPYRGLFFYSPFLMLSIWGMALMSRDEKWRQDAYLIAFLLVAYLLFNSSYYLWWGGWTYGPRHLIPAIPFLLLPLAWLWNEGRAWRALIAILILWAVCWNMLAVAVGPNYPQGYQHEALLEPALFNGLQSPLLNSGVKQFLAGEIQPNLGRLFGLNGLYTLIPLGIYWIGMLVATIVLLQRTRQNALFSGGKKY